MTNLMKTIAVAAIATGLFAQATPAPAGGGDTTQGGKHKGKHKGGKHGKKGAQPATNPAN